MDQNLTTITTTAVQIASVNTDQDHDLAAEFGFDPADPWAVAMTIDTPTGAVRWTFARELLMEGQFEPVGDGDVHVWPCLSPSGEAVVIVELDSPAGATLLQFPTRAIRDFVAASIAVVPQGGETVDVDAWIDQLLAN